jgi:hypothetical protein
MNLLRQLKLFGVAAGLVDDLHAVTVRFSALKLLWLIACGLSLAQAWHELPMDPRRGHFQLSARSFAVNETKPNCQPWLIYCRQR